MPENFDEVLGDLIDLDLKFKIYYEVRSPVEASLLDMFVKAGIVIVQAGIESLSSNILEKMAKGVTALQNLTLLREATTRQINVFVEFSGGRPWRNGKRLRAGSQISSLRSSICNRPGCGAYPDRSLQPLLS